MADALKNDILPMLNGEYENWTNKIKEKKKENMDETPQNYTEGKKTYASKQKNLGRKMRGHKGDGGTNNG